MATGFNDCRGSSIAADVDACIERMLDHFESCEQALRIDVLRALSTQAKLAYETERIREHLTKHPVSQDLINGITSQSIIYKMLAQRLTVDSCSCNYDVKSNVVMTTSVRWTLEPTSGTKITKKRKKLTSVVTKKKAMLTKYRFERVIHTKGEHEEKDEEETRINFSIVVAFGDDDANPQELLRFEMVCEHAYPTRYYEVRQISEPESEELLTKEEHIENAEHEENQTANRDGGVKKEVNTFGEELRAFHLSDEVLDNMVGWTGSGDEELNAVDVIGFFMALPVHEDEWLIDERVCEILF